MTRSTILISVVSVALAFCFACKKKDKEEQKAKAPEPTTPTAPTTPTTQPKPAAAATPLVAKLEPRSNSKVQGTVKFTPSGDKVKVEIEVTGLEKGEHGFHIHEKGDCSAPDASSAGGHFNPMGHEHAAPTADKQHAGDFGNITADEKGVARTTFETDQISLQPGQKNSVTGRAVVVHAKPDDLKSQPSGAAGARLACGVIEPAPSGAAPAPSGAAPAGDDKSAAPK